MKLPGIRHRDLAPSTALARHDLAAIDTACDELKRGGHGPVTSTIPLFPCIRGNWIADASSAFLVAPGPGEVAYFSLGSSLVVGEYLRELEVRVLAAATSAVVVELERVSPATVTVTSMAVDDRVSLVGQWARKFFQLVDRVGGRPIGLLIDDVSTYRIKVTSGQTNDGFFPVTLTVNHPPAAP